MNTYRHTFVATCPSDGEAIVYSLKITSMEMIHVEHIQAATSQFKSGYQERIADALITMLGGTHRIVAAHQGVTVETVRSPA